MLKTVNVTLPITDDYFLEIKNATIVRVIVDPTNTEQVIINDISVVDRMEELLPADGTVCEKFPLKIEFKNSLTPTASPIKRIYIQYRKLINC